MPGSSLFITAVILSGVMSYLELQSVSYTLADGRPLLRDVSFRVSSHERVALIGANGAGKTTLFKIVLGEIVPQKGSVVRSGSVGIMRQFVDSGTVEGLLPVSYTH